MSRNALVRNLVVGGMVLLMVAAVVWNLRTGPQATAGGMDAQNQEAIALGRQVYAAQCASCHGANLQGQPNWQTADANGIMPAPPHDQSGHTWHHGDEILFKIVKEGGQSVSPPGYINAMPPFGGTLTDREIWAVLSYIKSTWPPDIQAAQEQANQ